MTVMRALRDPDKVRRATRARVEAARAQLGYTPDLTARGLASQRTGLVAAIVPVLTNSLIAEIVQGLTDALVPSTASSCCSARAGSRAAAEEALVRAFLSRRVDAIYLTGISAHAGIDRHAPARAAFPSSKAAT